MNYVEFWEEKASRDDHREFILPNRSPEEFEREGYLQAEWLMQFHGSNDVVLEYGCGVGRVLKHIKAKEIHGVDVSSEFLNQAMKAGVPNIHQSNGINLPLEDEKFDFVYSLMVFQHCDRKDHSDQIKEIARVTKPGGKILIQFPRFDSGYYQQSDFVNIYKKSELEKLMSQVGISSYEINKGGLIGYSDRKNGPNREWFLLITRP